VAFAKLDVAILDSTLWIDRDARDVFITALLMAMPREYGEAVEQIAVRSLEGTGWSAPPGWYGFVPAAGIGIIARAGCETEEGLVALERLGSPEPDSRSQEFEGRRMIRVDGGYLILNYMKYRDRDHSAADRMRRLRARKKALRDASDGVTPSRDGEQENEHVTSIRHVTHSRGQKHTTTEAGEQASRSENVTVTAVTDSPLEETPRDGVTGPRMDPAWFAAQETEKRIRLSAGALCSKLYTLVGEMEGLDPKHREAMVLMRLVTAYDAPDGRQVGGVANPAGLSPERLEKSIEDAEWHLAEWRRLPGGEPGEGEGKADDV
jgi:hypothetical protein